MSHMSPVFVHSIIAATAPAVFAYLAATDDPIADDKARELLRRTIGACADIATDVVASLPEGGLNGAVGL